MRLWFPVGPPGDLEASSPQLLCELEAHPLGVDPVPPVVEGSPGLLETLPDQLQEHRLPLRVTVGIGSRRPEEKEGLIGGDLAVGPGRESGGVAQGLPGGPQVVVGAGSGDAETVSAIGDGGGMTAEVVISGGIGRRQGLDELDIEGMAGGDRFALSAKRRGLKVISEPD